MKETFRELINYTFQVLLVSYLLLLLAEELKAGFVSKYLNLNYVLIAVILLGILTVVFPHEKKIARKVIPLDYFMIGFISIAGGFIIFYKTKELKWLSYVISIVGGILIFLLSVLVLEENES